MKPVRTPVHTSDAKNADLQAGSSRARPIARSKRAKRRWTAQLAADFCRLTAEGKSAAAACRELGIARSQPYEHAKTDHEFAAAWLEAREIGADLLEDVAYRLATEGAEEVETDGNGNVRRRTSRGPNVAALMRTLQAWRPERWGDKATQIGIGVQVTQPVQHEMRLTLADLGDVIGRSKGLDLSGASTEETVDYLRRLGERTRELEPFVVMSDDEKTMVAQAAHQFVERSRASRRALPAGDAPADAAAADDANVTMQ